MAVNWDALWQAIKQGRLAEEIALQMGAMDINLMGLGTPQGRQNLEVNMGEIKSMMPTREKAREGMSKVKQSMRSVMPSRKAKEQAKEEK